MVLRGAAAPSHSEVCSPLPPNAVWTGLKVDVQDRDNDGPLMACDNIFCKPLSSDAVDVLLLF